VAGLLDDRQADAAMGDRVAQGHVGEVEAGRLDGQAQAFLQGLQMGDPAGGGDDSGKHVGLSGEYRETRILPAIRCRVFEAPQPPRAVFTTFMN
jgi:hypothetical protein